MVTVQLHNLLFTAYHGIFEEEKILGNEYIVDVSMGFHEKEDVISHIHDTINYATVYEIIKKRMNIPTQLLETVVMETGNEIHRRFPFLKSITITIKKLHPPVGGMQGSAGVKWHKEF
jgi:dihydroneopterin aldolase